MNATPTVDYSIRRNRPRHNGGRHSARHARQPSLSGGSGGGALLRPLVLFGRARHLPAFAVAVVVICLLAWWAGEWLSSQEMFDGPRARPPVTALAPLLLAVAVSATLYAADEELERTAAWRWPRLRAAQVVVLTTLAGAAVAGTALEDPNVYGAVEVARNTLACVGMITMAAPIIGGRLAWAPAFGYVTTIYLLAPKPVEPDTGWWTWPTQMSNSHSAWWAATAWFTLGLLMFAWQGSRPRRSEDT